MIVITIIIIVIIVHDYRNVYHCDYGPIPATTMFVWYEHPQFPAYAGHAADPSHIKNHPQLGRVRSSNVGDWGAAGVPIERAAQAPSLSIIQISWECVYVYIYIIIHTHHAHTHIYIYTHRCAYVVVIDTPRKGNSVNAGNKWIKGYCTLNFNESCWNYWSKLGLLKSGTPASVGMQHPKNSKTVIETAESWNMSNLVHIHQYGSIHLHPIDPIVIHCIIVYSYIYINY